MSHQGHLVRIERSGFVSPDFLSSGRTSSVVFKWLEHLARTLSSVIAWWQAFFGLRPPCMALVTRHILIGSSGLLMSYDYYTHTRLSLSALSILILTSLNHR